MILVYSHERLHIKYPDVTNSRLLTCWNPGGGGARSDPTAVWLPFAAVPPFLAGTTAAAGPTAGTGRLDRSMDGRLGLGKFI